MSWIKGAFLIIGVLAVLLGCGKKERRKIDTSGINVSIRIERLENSLFACSTEAEVLDFLTTHPSVAAVYFPDLPADNRALAARLFETISNPVLRDFKKQIDSLLSDFDESVARPLESAFKHLTYYYPETTIPKVKTMVTGFLGSDLYLSDSLIIIGLDYFGGPQARFRPDVYTYQLRQYDKHYIVPSILFFSAKAHNRLNYDDRSLLADMVWYGKNYEFVRYMMPETPDSLILGFSQEDLSKAEVSQKDIWAHVITNKLLYEQSEQKKQKYVGERPFTYEVGEDVPGGIGRWVGWKIVNKYFDQHPDQTIPELMENENARAIFEASGYRGERD